MSKKSATQLKTYKLCPRKWAYQYRLGLKPPQHPSASLGIAVHKLAEDWLRTGIPFNADSLEGRIFRPGLKHLPKPSPDLLLEHAFTTDHFRGFIDVFAPKHTPRPLILDHKTTGSFFYALSDESLRSDEQAIIYAYAGMQHTGASEVELRWVYYKTKGDPQAMAKTVILNRSFVDNKYNDLISQSAEIDKTPDNPLEVPGNMDACNAFGGCPFKNMCHGSKGRDEVSTLLEKLKKMNQEKSTGVAPQSVNPPESKVSKPVAVQAESKGVAKVAKAKAVKESVVVEAELEENETPKPSRTGPFTGFTLYINCMPSTGALDLSSYLHRLSKEVALQAGKDHYRLVEYGGGSALLAKAVERQLAVEPLEGDVFIDTYGRTASDVSDVLAAHADRVIRGIR